MAGEACRHRADGVGRLQPNGGCMKQVYVAFIGVCAFLQGISGVGAGPATMLQRIQGDRQIIAGTVAFNSPFGVRARDASGSPVQGVPVLIGPVTQNQPGVYLADEFGYRGFNAPPNNIDYGVPPPPPYFGVTAANGELVLESGTGGLIPSATIVGAAVLEAGWIASPVARTHFSVVRLQFLPLGKPVVAVEYFNASVGHYFVTHLQNEIDLLEAGAFSGWKRSVGSFVVWPTATDAPPGAVPVCRFFSSAFTSHFYTANPTECDEVVARWSDVWTLETREAFYIFEPNKATGECGAGLQPIYRMYNNRPGPNHRYITDRSLRDKMIAYGWRAEGYGPEAVMLCTAG